MTLFDASSAVRLLGELVTWETTDLSVPFVDLVQALTDAELDSGMARKMAPSHAFSRACNELSKERIIRKLKDDGDGFTRFQFTKEYRKELYEYETEAVLVLDKESGLVSCPERPDLAREAQILIDKHITHRNGADVSRIMNTVLSKETALFPLKKRGGLYFVPDEWELLTNKVQKFAGLVGAKLQRFPIIAGHGSDTTVADAVSEGLTKVISELDEAVEKFGEDTRGSTMMKAAEKVDHLRTRVEAYAAYLADRKSSIDEFLTRTQEKLEKKVVELSREKVMA